MNDSFVYMLLSLYMLNQYSNIWNSIAYRNGHYENQSELEVHFLWIFQKIGRSLRDTYARGNMLNSKFRRY